MASETYKKAYSEVLDILNHTKKDDVNKISPKFLEYLKKNSLKNYTSKLDHSLKIKDMHLNLKTKAVLAVIYRMFWCNKEERKIFDEKLRKNQIEYNKSRKNK